MKNRMQYILPKLLGITVLVGIAGFVLSIVFKLLLAGLVLGGIGTLIMKVAGKKRNHLQKDLYMQPAISNYDHGKGNNLRPLRKSFSTEESAIIPIY